MPILWSDTPFEDLHEYWDHYKDNAGSVRTLFDMSRAEVEALEEKYGAKVAPAVRAQLEIKWKGME